MPACTTRHDNGEAYVYHGQIFIPNYFSAGTVGSKVLVTLRDKAKIIGMRCPSCNRVYVPARSVCGECFEQINEYVQVSNLGTVESYTVCNESTAAQPVDTPVYAVIKLDGADNNFVHLLGEVAVEDISIGMRVQAVFREKADRKASILDIRYFKPL